MGNLEPSVQTFIFQRFLARAQNASKKDEVNPPECSMLASFYINGYGADINDDEAARLILHAARWGHDIAKAYAYRICRALKEDFLADDQMISNLWDMALEGSRMALQDLVDVAPDKSIDARRILRDGLAGTRARFFEPGTGLLHGFLLLSGCKRSITSRSLSRTSLDSTGSPITESTNVATGYCIQPQAAGSVAQSRRSSTHSPLST